MPTPCKIVTPAIFEPLHAAEMVDSYRAMPWAQTLPLAAVVDLLEVPGLGQRAVASARQLLTDAAGPQAAFARLLPGPAPVGLQLRNGLDSLVSTGGSPAQRQALAADLAAFADQSPLPSALRLGQDDISWQISTQERLLVRLMRQAAAQMMARGQAVGHGDEENGFQHYLQLPMLAINQLIYEQLGGEAPGACRLATGLQGLGDGMQSVRQLSACLGDVALLDPIGRLRLREATHAVLMAQPIPHALTVAAPLSWWEARVAADHPQWTTDAAHAYAAASHASEVAMPATARRLGQLLGEMMLAHRGLFNVALQVVDSDLEAFFAGQGGTL